LIPAALAAIIGCGGGGVTSSARGPTTTGGNTSSGDGTNSVWTGNYAVTLTDANGVVQSNPYSSVDFAGNITFSFPRTAAGQLTLVGQVAPSGIFQGKISFGSGPSNTLPFDTVEDTWTGTPASWTAPLSFTKSGVTFNWVLAGKLKND